VAVEFYPVSQVRSLAEALDLIAQAAAPGAVGVNVDLLHLMRSGQGLAALATAPADRILFGQLCDGPADLDPRLWAREAAQQRALPGEGDFDLPGFVAAMPASTRLSVEVPQAQALTRGLSPARRAARAVASCVSLLEGEGRDPGLKTGPTPRARSEH
jgi:sugar phosphate isomerase/epimerase